MNTTIRYDFLIDTNKYSGNFERELCGYLTGHWDGESHGGDQAKVFMEEEGESLFDDFDQYMEERGRECGGCD